MKAIKTILKFCLVIVNNFKIVINLKIKEEKKSLKLQIIKVLINIALICNKQFMMNLKLIIVIKNLIIIKIV